MANNRLAPDVKTKVPVTIRRATLDDAEQILQVYSNPGTYSGTLQVPYASVENWITRIKQQDNNRIMLVAVVDGVVVGNAAIILESNYRRRHAGDIGIGIADAFAGKGVGTALLAELLALADNWLHLLRLELKVYVDNAAAIALYRKMGFVIEGTHRAHGLRDGVLVDSYSMARLHPRQPRLPES